MGKIPKFAHSDAEAPLSVFLFIVHIKLFLQVDFNVDAISALSSAFIFATAKIRNILLIYNYLRIIM